MTMTAITPELKLFISQEENSNGIHINSLILKHKGNHYHLLGGTNDTIHLFTESIALYVLSINEALGTMALNAFMAPEPDPINTIYLHTPKDIKETLGSGWESMSPEAIAMKLIDYLI